MRMFIPWCLVLAVVISAPFTAVAAVNVGITLGNAPPPPVVVFRSEPRLVFLPTGGVAYYDGPSDYDYFRYGSNYYIYNGGYWYRAPRYRGPFVAIREAYVPRAFYGLNDRGYHWRHAWKNVPPGQVRKMERRHDQREMGHEQGKHGHGHGHDKD